MTALKGWCDLPVEKDAIGVYVHIPFCARKCPYCDFASVASAPPEEEYVRCVIAELVNLVKKTVRAGRPLESVYLGGGTPSLFSPGSVSRVIASIKAAFTPVPDCEVTIEANPESIDAEKLDGCRKAGANRLSIGFQSLIDTELKTLGRAHTAQRAVDAFRLARASGFGNIGVDLIYGIPGQGVDSFSASLSKVVELRPEHVSIYGLTYEYGTPMREAREAGRFNGLMPAEEAEEEMYRVAAVTLKRAGYMHYEVSNWALPGFESRHNSRYWGGGDYIGLGVSAHSYLSSPGWGRRWWNHGSVAGYMERVSRGADPSAGLEALDRQKAMTESLMLGLRMLDKGLEAGPFLERFGLLPKEAFRDSAGLEKDGLLRTSGEDLLLTAAGVLISNEVFLRMLPDSGKRR